MPGLVAPGMLARMLPGPAHAAVSDASQALVVAMVAARTGPSQITGMVCKKGWERRTGVDDCILRHINWLGQEVGGEVADKEAVSDVGGGLELDSLNGLVVTVVHELRISREIPRLRGGYRCIVTL